MTTVIAFDVNETLLDLSALDAAFEELLGSAALRGKWFAQMLQVSFVGGLTGAYVDFSTAQRAALRMVAERAGRSVTTSQVSELVKRMSSLPPHPEVPDALEALRAAPLKITALTNSVQDVTEAQLGAPTAMAAASRSEHPVLDRLLPCHQGGGVRGDSSVIAELTPVDPGAADL